MNRFQLYENHQWRYTGPMESKHSSLNDDLNSLSMAIGKCSRRFPNPITMIYIYIYIMIRKFQCFPMCSYHLAIPNRPFSTANCHVSLQKKVHVPLSGCQQDWAGQGVYTTCRWRQKPGSLCPKWYSSSTYKHRGKNTYQRHPSINSKYILFLFEEIKICNTRFSQMHFKLIR